MTTDELNAIVKAVLDELEKAGVDFDFKAETPQPTDLVYVMRGTADKYMGITVKWQNLLDIIVKKATDAKDEAVSAKDIALQTLATIQGIESNISTMKSSIDASEANVASMKASIETSESNVTQMKSEVSEMKTSVEGTKTEVEGLKSDVTNLKAQTQTIVDNAKEDVTGLLDTKVDYSDALSYTDIINSSDLTNKVPSASALKEVATLDLLWTNASPTSEFASQFISFQHINYKFLYFEFMQTVIEERFCFYIIRNVNISATISTISYDNLKIFMRGMTISGNGAVFSSAYRSDTYGAYATDNTILIPYRIYGVK